MTKATEDKFPLIRLSVPVRQKVCIQITDELKKIISTSLDVKEKVSQASKVIFGLNLRHVCIYKVEGKQVIPISQYGCDYKLPFNYDERKGIISRVIDTLNPCLVQLHPDDLESILFASAQMPEIKSEFVLPIKNTKGEITGILELSSSIWYDFRKEEIENYVSLAEQLSELIGQ